MPAWICVTCGVQYPDTDRLPGGCPICEDERQYVGWHGQQWTTMAEIARGHRVVSRNEEATWSASASSRPLRSASGRCWCALRTATCCGTVSAARRAGPWADRRPRRNRRDLPVPPRISTRPTSSSPTPSTPASSSRAPTSTGSSDGPRWIELFDDDIEPVPGSPWPASADTSTAPPCCTGPLAPTSVARCSPETPSPLCKTAIGSVSCGAFPTSFPSIRPPSSRSPAESRRFAFDRVYGGWWGRVVVEDGAAPSAAPPTATSRASMANDHHRKPPDTDSHRRGRPWLDGSVSCKLCSRWGKRFRASAKPNRCLTLSRS